MKLLAALVLSFAACGTAHAQFVNNDAPWKKEYDACTASQSPNARLASCGALLKLIPAGHTDAGWAHWYMADARLALKDLDGAIAETDLASQLLPEERHVLNMRCWVRGAANRDLAAARKACDDANAQNPDDPDQWDSAGLVALRQHRWADAQKAYQKALGIDRSLASPRYGLGLAFIALGDEPTGQANLKLATDRDAAVADTDKGFGMTPDEIKVVAAKYPPVKAPARSGATGKN